MSILSVTLRRYLLLPLALGCLAGVARADLVWSRDTGWRVEGGVLSGLTGADGRTALDLMNKARLAEEDHHYHTALKAYAKVVKKYPTSVYAPEAYYHTGKIRNARHQYPKAFEAYQSILSRYPNSKRFNELIDTEFIIASKMLDGARTYFWGVIPGFPNRQKGVRYMGTLVASAPYSDYAPLALMECANGLIYLGDTEEAIDVFDRVVNTYPSSVMAPLAYLGLAHEHAYLVQGAYYDQAQAKQAITYDEDFMILYPSDTKVADAAQGLDSMKKMLAQNKMKIGDFYFYKRDNYTAARVFYNEAITSYPDSDVAKLAHERLRQVEAKAAAAAKAGGEKKKHFLFF